MKDKAINIINFKFGLLQVIKRGPTKKNRAYWLCQCECGNTTTVRGSALRKGHVKSCGCLVSKLSIKDITGRKYGRLIAVEMAEERTLESQVKWLCHCECSAILIVRGADLRSGNTKSCGCLREDNRFKHGHSIVGKRSPEYNSWSSMLSRGNNPNDHAYPRYGGRGIKVCEKWHKFKNFFKDMGQRPKGTTIDRINNDGNYEPENCRWATKKTQQRNRQVNIRITFNGETHCLSAWAEKIGITGGTLRYRIKKWPLEKALTLISKNGG